MPPAGDWIAVWTPRYHTSGQARASRQKRPDSRGPSQDLAQVPGAPEEIGAGLDDAELVAGGVGHHDVTFFGVLADQPPTPLHRLGDGAVLVVEVRAGQVQVDSIGPVVGGDIGGHETEADLGVVAGNEGTAFFHDHVPVEHSRPERRHRPGVFDFEGDG